MNSYLHACAAAVVLAAASARVIALTYKSDDKGPHGQSMKGKTFTAVVLRFHKPRNMGLKEGEVAVVVRWLDAPPKLASGVVNKEMSLSPDDWKEQYTCKVLEAAKVAMPPSASAAPAGSSSSSSSSRA